MLGYIPGFKHDPTFWDKAEELPGCFIINREITKAVNGEKYFINDEETGKPERLPAIDYKAFLYYYELWENFHYFGYPQGMNWIDAPEWFNNILKTLENAYTQIQNFIEAQEMKKARMKNNG